MNPSPFIRTKTAPDLFIIGGARCGSTSLHYYLDQHPNIHMCQPDKEPSFFCDIYGVKDLKEYVRNFAGARLGQLLGDASTPYLTCPASASLIHAANPHARILAILRQPADRAYSLYLKMCSQGHESAPTFEEALACEEVVLRDPPAKRHRGYHHNYLYFHSGLYAAQMERYFAFFPREQIRVFLFEEFVASPQRVCDSIVEWLGLDSMPQVNPEPRNRAVQPRSLRLQHWIRNSLDPALRRLRFPWRGQWVEHLLEWNTDSRPAPRLAPALRCQLTERYVKDIASTAALLGRSLDHWLGP